MDGWKYTLVVTSVALILGVLGAPTWSVYGVSFIVAAALLPRLFDERAPDVPNVQALVRGVALIWLPAAVILGLAAIAAGSAGLAVVIGLTVAVLLLATRQRGRT